MTRYTVHAAAGESRGEPSTRRRAAAAAIVAALAASLAACSFAIPSLVPDGNDSTGSIRAIDAIEPGLGQEDTRRAMGALAIALDPQGSGAPVNWDNPDSRAKGTVTPVGQPFVRDDEVCRDFEALVVRTGRPARREGTACRISTGSWSVQYLGFRKARS